MEKTSESKKALTRVMSLDSVCSPGVILRKRRGRAAKGKMNERTEQKAGGKQNKQHLLLHSSLWQHDS